MHRCVIEFRYGYLCICGGLSVTYFPNNLATSQSVIFVLCSG